MEGKNILKKIDYNAPVILSFALFSLGALILQYVTGGYTTSLLFSVYRSSPASIFFYLRLFGHILGHAGIEHYVNNFIIILLIGPMLEEKYGSGNMAAMILVTAAVTGLINIILFPYALLGASGIAFMLIVMSSYVNIKEGKIPLTLILIVIAFLGKEIFAGIVSRDNISQLTHIAGGAMGGLFGFYFNRKS